MSSACWSSNDFGVCISREVTESFRCFRSSLVKTFPGSTVLPREARLRWDPLFFLEESNQLVEVVIADGRGDLSGLGSLRVLIGGYDISV